MAKSDVSVVNHEPVPLVKPIEIKEEGLSAKIKEILKPRFVHYERFADVLATALATKQNVWFYGDGGYGKSSMVEAVFTGLELLGDTYIQAFGQGMTPERLVGNLDIKTLNKEGLFRFNIKESFLVKRFAIFEEMPDAAIPVLFLLKDTLERRQFRDGVQKVNMETQTIVVCSNKSPQEVAEYGVDAAALIQRWPLELNLKWPTHNYDDYRNLLVKQSPYIDGPDCSNMIDTFAKLFSTAADMGEAIPPRVALAAVRAVKGAAKIAGRKTVDKDDMRILQYVRGLRALGSNIEKEVVDAMLRVQVLKEFQEVMSKFNEIQVQAAEASNPIECLQAYKKLYVFHNDRIQNLVVTDDLNERKQGLLKTAQTTLESLNSKAIDLTRV